ncbi:MAG: hypothetical protein ABR568_17570 [Pyrinomonadaceae bacterium]
MLFYTMNTSLASNSDALPIKIRIGYQQNAGAIVSIRVENNATHYVSEGVPQKAKWARVQCSFPIVKRWDKTNDGQGQPNTNEMFKMASNPGEYEFKVLWNNKRARSIKFTVGPDGKLDNGVASANGRDRACHRARPDHRRSGWTVEQGFVEDRGFLRQPADGLRSPAIGQKGTQ